MGENRDYTRVAHGIEETAALWSLHQSTCGDEALALVPLAQQSSLAAVLKRLQIYLGVGCMCCKISATLIGIFMGP